MLQVTKVHYQTVPGSLLPLMMIACAISFLLVIACLFAFGTGEPFRLTVFLHVATMLMTVVAFMLTGKKRTFIEFDNHEMRFPLNLAPDLLFRTDRPWDDIAAAGVEDAANDYDFVSYEEEVKKKLIFIYFKSGGHVNLYLRNMELPGLKDIVDNLVEKSQRGACTPDLLELQRVLPRLLIEGARLELERVGEETDFTSLWEEEFESYIGTTNFVPLEPGHTLQNGKFKIERGIACGGMSAVYLGQRADEQKIVVKESSVPSRCDPAMRDKARELFEREALLLYKLNHPRIAKVIDYFVEDARDYLVLEYIPGRSIRQIVRKDGPFDEKKSLALTLQICEIVNYLHCQDPPVIHRDLTPDNLLLRDDGQIMLIDFGAANEFIGTATGTVIGKQCFIAPEQFRGRAVPQSDLYSLGCTMHYMLTGQDPEPLSTSHPRLVNEEISQTFSDAVSAATELDLEKRVKSADGLIDLLDREQLGQKIELRSRRKQPA